MNKTNGEIAYDAYCAAVDWKSIRGEQLPSFAEMRVKNTKIADAWEAAGNAVQAHIHMITGGPG